MIQEEKEMKYIDAEKLKAEIERLREQYQPYLSDFENGCREGRNDVLDDLHFFITSLQQKQPEPVKGKFVFPKFLYARTLDNKTIDVSYAPQDMNAIEYIRNDSIEEQPEIGLEKFTQKMND